MKSREGPEEAGAHEPSSLTNRRPTKRLLPDARMIEADPHTPSELQRPRSGAGRRTPSARTRAPSSGPRQGKLNRTSPSACCCRDAGGRPHQRLPQGHPQPGRRPVQPHEESHEPVTEAVPVSPLSPRRSQNENNTGIRTDQAAFPALENIQDGRAVPPQQRTDPVGDLRPAPDGHPTGRGPDRTRRGRARNRRATADGRACRCAGSPQPQRRRDRTSHD